MAYVNGKIFQYRFYLRNAAGLYYYVSNNTVLTSATPKYIQHLSKEWMDTEISWIRDKDLLGIFRSMTNQYSFVEDGLLIVRYVYLTQGFEGYCKLEITRLSDTNAGIYDSFYSGELDFSTFNGENILGSIQVIEGGTKAILDANKDIDYSILIDTTDCLQVNTDGITLQSQIQWVPIVEADQINTDFDDPHIIVANAWVSTEGDFPLGTDSNQRSMRIYIGGSSITDGQFANYMFVAAVDMQIDFTLVQSGRVRSNVAPTSGFEIVLMVVGADKVIKTKNIIYSIAPGVLPISLYVNFNVNTTYTNINVAAGDRLFLLYGGQFSSAGKININFDINGNSTTSIDNYHNFQSRFRMPPTVTNAYRYWQVCDKVVTQMSGSAATFESSLLQSSSFDLDNNPFQTTLTSGDALRGFANSNIKTSLSQLFKTSSDIWLTGIGVEGAKIKIEKAGYFFDPTVIIADLGEVFNFTYSPTMDFVFNGLKNGYKDQSYDNLNGRNEFNSEMNWLFPIKRKSSIEDQSSEIRADNYGVEMMRSNLSNKKTQDSSSDNDTFLLEIDNTLVGGKYNLYRPFGTITGLYFPTTRFNFGVSPKRNFFRNSPMYASILDNNTGTIFFQTSTKYAGMVSQFGTNPTITENANVAASELRAKLFKPYTFKFTAQPPLNMMQLMATNPRGCFRFKWNGVSYKGFPMEVGTYPSNYNVFNFVLLCTPDTDVTPLIYAII